LILTHISTHHSFASRSLFVLFLTVRPLFLLKASSFFIIITLLKQWSLHLRDDDALNTGQYVPFSHILLLPLYYYLIFILILAFCFLLLYIQTNKSGCCSRFLLHLLLLLPVTCFLCHTSFLFSIFLLLTC